MTGGDRSVEAPGATSDASPGAGAGARSGPGDSRGRAAPRGATEDNRTGAASEVGSSAGDALARAARGATEDNRTGAALEVGSSAGDALARATPRRRSRVAASLRRSIAIAIRRPRAALWTTLALACALFVAGGAAIAAVAVDRWAAAHPGASASLVIYLGDGVDEARAAALIGELGRHRGVERAELVPAAESASRLTRALGADPALLDGLDLASLPASVEVRLAPGVRDVVAMSPTLRALRDTPGVADVVVEDGGGDPVAGDLATARSIAWAGAAVFAALALLIAIAAVRVGLERPEREAAVLSLLGASPAFSAIPSALAGALYGACAALVAAMTLGLAVHASRLPLTAIELAAPDASIAAGLLGLVALGGLIGLIGGGLAGVARAR